MESISFILMIQPLVLCHYLNPSVFAFFLSVSIDQYLTSHQSSLTSSLKPLAGENYSKHDLKISFNHTHISELYNPVPDIQLIKINRFIYQMVTMLLKCKWLVSVNCLISYTINLGTCTLSCSCGTVHLKSLGIRRKICFFPQMVTLIAALKRQQL